MNCILVEPGEWESGRPLALTGRRADHIRTVLRAKPGDRLRLGLVGGPLGAGTVLAVTPASIELDCVFEAVPPPPAPAIDLLLALPRPKVMKRVWSVLAQFGVRRVGLLNAEKVEKPYFDSHVLAPAFIRERFLEGCEQVGLTRLPEVSIHPRFRPFVEDELDGWSPGARRILAHPGGEHRFAAATAGAGSLLLAVGPEGGWNEFERAKLEERGFRPAGLACGPLRTDAACAALLALARESLADFSLSRTGAG